MRFRLFAWVSVMAISISLSASVSADLFKDLKKALKDVEEQLAPQEGGAGSIIAPGGQKNAAGGASQALGGVSVSATAQPDDFGDSESFIKNICTQIIYRIKRFIRNGVESNSYYFGT